MLIEHAGVFARPEVLKEGFQAAAGKPSKDAAHAVTSHELALLQVLHPPPGNAKSDRTAHAATVPHTRQSMVPFCRNVHPTKAPCVWRHLRGASC